MRSLIAIAALLALLDGCSTSTPTTSGGKVGTPSGTGGAAPVFSIAHQRPQLTTDDVRQ